MHIIKCRKTFFLSFLFSCLLLFFSLSNDASIHGLLWWSVIQMNKSAHEMGEKRKAWWWIDVSHKELVSYLNPIVYCTIVRGKFIIFANVIFPWFLRCFFLISQDSQSNCEEFFDGQGLAYHGEAAVVKTFQWKDFFVVVWCLQLIWSLVVLIAGNFEGSKPVNGFKSLSFLSWCKFSWILKQKCSDNKSSRYKTSKPRPFVHLC